MNLEKYQPDHVETSRDSLAPDFDTRELRDSTRARVLDFQSKFEREKILRSSNEAGEWSEENQAMLAYFAFPETSSDGLKKLRAGISDYARENYLGSVTPEVIEAFFGQFNQFYLGELPLAA